MKHSNMQIGRFLCDVPPVQRGVNELGALSPFVLNFAMLLAVKKAQVDQDGLKFYTRVSL